MSDGSLHDPSSADYQLLGIKLGGLGAKARKSEMISSRGNQQGLRAECDGGPILL